MTNKEGSSLQIGDQIVLGQKHEMVNSGVPESLAGSTQTITRLDPGGNCVCFKTTTHGELYVYYQSILKKVGKTSSKKPTKFNRESVKTPFNVGGNEKIKTEITSRVHEARKNLENAVLPDKFRDSMKVVDEQLRQAKLLHNALVKFD